ncbi:hypothetical protein H0A36_19910 [Endozoicomonas sp. SM1973]|uniref:Glycine zipper 2TM domain-containing protein n=1 Tax=Spartinivicinus marinus TaxID=2994442 RepID=A0A853IGL6_9GAMM|nr:RT0821/Lpp0805 family surface protein [Spartinivicinus marinus]NYZ68285.1 hypothetical protein [Spartinivicinus marinus]
MAFLKRSFILLIVLSLSSCAEFQPSNTFMGSLLGAGVGAGIGYAACKDKSKVARRNCMIGGGLAGGIIGGVVGSYMDSSDQQRAYQGLRSTPSKKQYHWTNPRTGNRFTIKPLNKQSKKGSTCRDYLVWSRPKGAKKAHRQRGSTCY